MPHCHCMPLHCILHFKEIYPLSIQQSCNSGSLNPTTLLEMLQIIQVFFSHNILDRRTDRDPEMMAKVFRSPGEYLPGPDSIPELRRDMQHFVIVGGGAAGLVSAYTLLRLGHKVGRYQTLKTGHLFPHLDGWVL